MNDQLIDVNPFDLTKASDFSDSEIFDYWVDLTGPDDGPGLISVLKPTLVMPMLLLGGKGSGKTHLMRFCSAPVQAMRNGGNLADSVEQEGYLGVYLLSDDLNTGRFRGKGQAEDVWSAIFSYSFELWLSHVLMSTLRELVSKSSNRFDEQGFFQEIAKIFDKDVKNEFNSFETFLEFLRREQKQIDYSVNNSALTRKIDSLSIKFSPGRLAFGIPQIAEQYTPSLRDAIIVYLIDEVENFTAEQQKFLNTLIRYRRGKVSIKLGGRLYGIKTYDTLGSGEPIKRDAEYERVELDSLLREKGDQYGGLARKLVLKRLNQSNLRHKVKTPEDIDKFFASISRENAFRAFSLSIVEARDKKGIKRPCITRLRSKLIDYVGTNTPTIDEIVKNLKMHEHPLLEKLNVFLIYKDWAKPETMLERSIEISRDAHLFYDGHREDCQKYAQSFDHFGQDMLAQLLRDCGQKGAYAGLDNLIQLSQGVPRNLLGILKHIYRNALFSGERPFDGGTISVSSQTDGVKDSANWFWDDAQPDSNGAMVREAVDALAEFFREVRYSDKPSECDLSSFSVALDSLSVNAKKTIEMAENWSYLVRIKGGARNKNSHSVNAKYQLSPMLAPRWGLSPLRGGTIEIQDNLANSIFDGSERGKFHSLVEERVRSMTANAPGKTSDEQGSLFPL